MKTGNYTARVDPKIMQKAKSNLKKENIKPSRAFDLFLLELTYGVPLWLKEAHKKK